MDIDGIGCNLDLFSVIIISKFFLTTEEGIGSTEVHGEIPLCNLRATSGFSSVVKNTYN